MSNRWAGVRGWAGVGACSAEGVCGGRNLAKIRFHNCARTQALFQNRSERGTLCEKQLTQAPPFLTFSSAERLEPLVKINIDEGQGGKIMANWTFLRRPLRAKQLRNLIRKRHTYLNKFPAARAKWLYTIWINIVSRGLRCIQVSRRLVNGILSERHDILKRLRSDRQDAVCAQSRFPQAEFKDVVAKGSAPRFGDLMKMIRFLIS